MLDNAMTGEPDPDHRNHPPLASPKLDSTVTGELDPDRHSHPSPSLV